MVLVDGSIDSIRYLRSGVHCLIKGARARYSFEKESAEYHGTVDEDPICSLWGRTKHIDAIHDLVRDACDAGKVRVVCTRTSICFKTLGIQKFHKYAKTVLNVV